MSKEAIEQVKGAEEQAAAIRKAAALEVKKRLDAAENAGKECCAAAEKEAERQSAALIDEAGKTAANVLEESRRKAQEDTAAVCRRAEENMEDAVGLIIEGVMQRGSK